MQPKIRERLVVSRLALRDFIGVVHGDMVNSTGMNIKRLAEVFSGHGRTLNMPAGEADAQGRFPLHLALGRSFDKLRMSTLLDAQLPEREVGRIFLFRVCFYPRAFF